MIFNEEKFRNVVLFFLNHCNNAKLGKTKLLKLFYFLDFGFYQKYKRSITGSTYVRYKFGPIPTEAERVFKQLQKEYQVISFQKTFHGKSQTRYEALAEFNSGIFNPEELDFMWAVARFFSPHNAADMTALAHSETPWRVTPQGEYVSYELATMRSLAFLEEVGRLKEISCSLSADDIIRNTPGLLKEIKGSIKGLPKAKFFSFEEVFGQLVDYTPYFSSYFRDKISRRFAGIKKFVENKVKIIIKKPFSGEPLKHDLEGLRSERIRGNFILIYSICKECRRKGNDEIFQCRICKETDDNSIVFICIAPHDDSYKIAKKLVKNGQIYG